MIRADVRNRSGEYLSMVEFPMKEAEIKEIVHEMGDTELEATNAYSEYSYIAEAMPDDEYIDEFNMVATELKKVLRPEEDWKKFDSIVMTLDIINNGDDLLDALKTMEQYVYIDAVGDEWSLGNKIVEMNGGIPKWLAPYVEFHDIGYALFHKSGGDFSEFGFIYKKEATNADMH